MGCSPSLQEFIPSVIPTYWSDDLFTIAVTDSSNDAQLINCLINYLLINYLINKYFHRVDSYDPLSTITFQKSHKCSQCNHQPNDLLVVKPRLCVLTLYVWIRVYRGPRSSSFSLFPSRGTLPVVWVNVEVEWVWGLKFPYLPYDLSSVSRFACAQLPV